jgi:predicted nucleic-acid-binding Zn-ribbon protein
LGAPEEVLREGLDGPLAKCPRCGNENSEPEREWVGGAKTSKPMKVQRFVCSSCGTTYVAWRDSKTGTVKTMTRKG